MLHEVALPKIGGRKRGLAERSLVGDEMREVEIQEDMIVPLVHARN